MTVTAGNALTVTNGGVVALGGTVTLDVAVDDSTIEVSGDSLRLKDAGVTNAKLANNSVTVTAGNALTVTNGGVVALGGTVTLDVAVDNSSIEVNSDALRIKALGVTSNMLAGGIAKGKLTNSSVTVNAGSALSGGGTVELGSSVQLGVIVDNSTIEVNTATVPAWTRRGADLVGLERAELGRDCALSADGSVLVVSAPYHDRGNEWGILRVFAWNGSAWTQRGADIFGAVRGDEFGAAVAISADGNTVAATSTRHNSGYGHARVFTWSGTTWNQLGNEIEHNVQHQGFGGSLAMSGDGYNLLLSTRTSWLPNNVTFARAFSWSGTAWVQRGSDLIGHYQDRYGITMDASGDNIAVGDVNTVRAYSWSGTDWQLRGSQIDGEEIYARGGVVRISGNGNFLLIGSPYAKMGGVTERGSIRVYAWSGSSWVKRGDTIGGETVFDNFGETVAINTDGTVIAGGSWRNESNRGSARVYSWSGTAWIIRGSEINGQGGDQERATYSLSMNSDGSLIAIGAPYSAPSSNTRAGVVRVYNWPKTGLSVKALGITNAMLAGSIANDKLASSFVSVSAGGALTVTGGGTLQLGQSVTLNVAVDDSSIEINNDALRVKESGITNAMLFGGISNDKLAGSISNDKLANNSLTVTAGSALTVTNDGVVALGGSITLDVAVDDSSIQVFEDALRVKESGITDSMLAGSISNGKLTNDSVTVSTSGALTGGGEVELGEEITLEVAVDDSTIEIDSNALRVKDAGITNAKLANNSVTVSTGNALTGGGPVELGDEITINVAVDDSSIQVSNDALRVKESGITNAMLFGGISNDKLAGSISNDKLANNSLTVTAGSALTVTNDGVVALGGSITLDVAVDDSSIQVFEDALRVKESGITDSMLAGSISNGKLTNDSVTVSTSGALTGGGEVELGEEITLGVTVDDSTIEINSNELRVKDAGITNAKLANDRLSVNAGDGLASGGTVVLGQSVSLTVDSTVVRTSGAQSIGGTKTFSSAAVVSDATASNSYSTGCLKLAGGLGVAGKINAGNDWYATAFNATSDATLKRDIAPISGALDSISRITPVEYRFNFLDSDTLHYGVLAQDLEEKGLGDIVRHGKNGKLAVEYNSLTGLLLAAVKDLSAQVQDLQNRVRFD